VARGTRTLYDPVRSTVIVPRRAPPPDFRYVWLAPGPRLGALTLAAGTVSLSSIGLALGPQAEAWSATGGSLPLGIAVAGGAVAAVALARQIHRPRPPRGAREVPMAVVPWGVIVDPGAEPRILRWPAICKIDVFVSHTLHGGTPTAVSSLVTIHTRREVLAGRAPGAVGLESLTVNVDAYGEESACPPSLDLDGHEPIDDCEIAPVARLLLRSASDHCSSGRGAARLALPAGSYRTLGARAAGPETLELLRCALRDDTPGPADPRPVAALVAGLLEARELVPSLIRLGGCPHPIVAATARAAALRLGAVPSRAGAVAEVAEFLFEEDASLIAKFADPATSAHM
jgi:hypothetical protein